MSSKSNVNKVIDKAIHENDIGVLQKLKDAFDEVHMNDTEVKVECYDTVLVINSTNLPDDDTYESINKLLTAPLRIPPPSRRGGPKYLPELWMGSFPKPTTIKHIPKGIMMPKFDGVSAGAKFIKNDDGVIVLSLAHTRQGQNITAKMQRLTTKLINALDKEFKNEQTLSICIRGEIVIKDKTLTTSAPAPYVAGKINGGDEVFEAALDTLEFVPYEVMRFETKVKTRLTQEEVHTLLRKMGMLFYEPIAMKNYDINECKEAFNAFCTKTLMPLDGVVYCSSNWTYPITDAETMDSVYGKYAWKPSNAAMSILTNIEYSIARDGKLEPMVLYEPIVIDGKTYARAKISISRLLCLKGIGIGSLIVVKIANGISPYIDEFQPNDEVVSYELPKVCPFCTGKLKLTVSEKNSTLRCLNPNCDEIKVQCYKNFMKVLSIKGVAEKKIQSLEPLNFDNIISTYFDAESVKNIVLGSKIKTFFQALGYGGEQTVLKLLNKTQLKDIIAANENAIVNDHIDDIAETLNRLNEGTSEFIDDAIDLIMNM